MKKILYYDILKMLIFYVNNKLLLDLLTNSLNLKIFNILIQAWIYLHALQVLRLFLHHLLIIIIITVILLTSTLLKQSLFFLFLPLNLKPLLPRYSIFELNLFLLPLQLLLLINNFNKLIIPNFKILGCHRRIIKCLFSHNKLLLLSHL